MSSFSTIPDLDRRILPAAEKPLLPKTRPAAMGRLLRHSAMAALTVILWANMAPPVMAAVTFTAVTGTGNSLNAINVGNNAAPTFIDIDSDGDFDAFIGELNGTIWFFENSGGPQNPIFGAGTQVQDNEASANIDVGQNSAPAFADLDDDGDLDLFSGESGGTIKYYENLDDETPDQAGPVFVALPSSNRLSEVAVSGGYSTPAFVDFGGDGDMDAYVGSGSGELQLWENVGAAFNNSTGDFVDNLDVVANTKASLVNRAAPALVDIDGNNRVDAFVGEETGTLRHYYNILNRYFDRTTEATLNPLFNIDIGSNSMPFFVDIDGDGDMDAFIGAADGTIKFYRNDTPIPADLTVTKTGTGSGTVTSSPTGINCGGTCTATFTGTVTLSAAATAGSTFAGWSGGGCSGTDTCEVTLTGDTTITATFSKVILVKWQSAAQAVAEDVGQVTVTAVLTDDAGQALTATAPVTVPFTVSGTATGSGTDHNLANGSIAIAVGLSAGNTTFTVTNDELKEAAETIIVTMGTPTNATAGSVVVHTVTITDNDAGDLNLDEKVDLVDAILALQVLTGQTPAASVSTAGDIDGDGRIGLGDVIFILERVDGQR